MSITQDDFKKIWASTSSVPEYTFSDADYQDGWEFVGNLPPTRAMWDTLQRRNDQKMKFLQDNGSMCFNSVADMVATDLEAGQTALTKGYYSVNDGGSALYTIREKDGSDVEDGGHIIFLDNDNVAEIIAPKDTAESYGIIAGSVDYATTNAQRIQALLYDFNSSDGITITFGIGDYYFDNYIPIRSNCVYCGSNQVKTRLIFTDNGSSGFKVDKDMYYQEFYIGHMTIQADLPIDFTTPVKEFYHCKFEYLTLIGDDCCVQGTDSGKSSNNGTLFFHVEWYKIYIQSNNIGFKNLLCTNTVFYEDIIDQGRDEKILFYNVTGVFNNINCSYGENRLEYVWYFKRLFTDYTNAVICYNSNLEDIQKSFIYVEDDTNWGLSEIYFENVILTCYNQISGSTYPLFRLGTVANVDLFNVGLRYFADTRAEGTPHISYYDQNGNCRFNVPIDWVIALRRTPVIYIPPTPVTQVTASPEGTFKFVNQFKGVEAEFFYGPRYLSNYELLVNSSVKTVPITDVVTISADSSDGAMYVIKFADALVNAKVIKPGQLLTVINGKSSNFGLNYLNSTTNFNFAVSKTLAPGQSATYVLAYDGTYFTWVNIA